MNKILVVEDIKNISDGNYLLEYTKNISLIINGNSKIHSLSNNSLNIDIKDKASLELEMINILDKDINIKINIYDNSNLYYNMVIINEGKHKATITINMLGNNSLAKIRLRAINKTEESNIDIICNGTIASNTINNELLEDLKGLLINNDTIKISPNMQVFTNEVMANHLVTIGSFNKDELFYLTSKGLSEKKAKELLIETFTTNKISEEFKEKIKMEVKNIE